MLINGLSCDSMKHMTAIESMCLCVHNMFDHCMDMVGVLSIVSDMLDFLAVMKIVNKMCVCNVVIYFNIIMINSVMHINRLLYIIK